MNFLIGFIMLGVGFLLALKPQQIINIAGGIDSFNRGVMGSFGGSKFFYQLLGVLLILGAGFIMFGGLF